MQAASPHFPSPARANYALAVLLAACILSFVDRQILNLLIGPIRAEFGIDDFQASLLQGFAFVAFYAALGIPLGRLADRWNRKKLIALGIFYWSTMTVVCGFASSFSMLFLGRMGVGMGEAALAPATYSLLSDSFRPEKLARAISTFVMGITVGGGLAYVLGGSVIQLIAGADSISIPLVGAMHSWQLAFVIVGLPGFLIGTLALFIREPARKDVVVGRNEPVHSPTVKEVLRFIAHRAGVYGPIYLGVSLLAILGNGSLSWYPTFLARTYGLSISQAALQYGSIYGVFGTLGTLGGALLTERLTRSGYTDAALRAVCLISLGLIPLGVIAPLAPTLPLALGLTVPFVLLINGFYGVSITALQLVTPNQMRGVVSATFGLTANLIGLGLGPTSVGALTTFFFRDDASLRYSLSLVALVVTPLAAVILWKGLRRYRLALSA